MTQDARTSGATRGNVTLRILGAQSSATLAVTATRQMTPQIFPQTIVVRGVDDMNTDGLADIVVQQGTAISYYPRSIPAGQTVKNSATFNFGPVQVFTKEDLTTPLPLPSSSWSIRN